MRFGLRQDPIESELRRQRPEPDPDLVDQLVDQLSTAQRVPARALRIAFAGALTVALLAVSAAFGGVSYAASAVSQAIQTVNLAPSPDSSSGTSHNVSQSTSPSGPSVTKRAGVTPGADQYKPGCGNGGGGPPGNHNGFPGPCPKGP